ATGEVRKVYRSPRRRSGFGSAVAIRGDRVLLGAPDVGRGIGRGSGRAYLFSRRTGVRLATYRVGLPAESGAAGWAVALGHGIAVVGAPQDGEGSVTVFRAPVE